MIEARNMRNPTNPLAWFMGRYRVRLLLRAAGRSWEFIRYAFVRPHHLHHFHIVSTQRNASTYVLGCLNSVEFQRYPKDCYRHLVIDDDSTDDTPTIIEEWCKQHPGHNVDLVKRSRRRGGTWNTLDGIRQGDSESIVVELNGDDWLPDPGVLSFLNKVYRDPRDLDDLQHTT